MPIAIVCSDIHLCHTAPVARSAETDWYVAMNRYLSQLRDLKESLNVPIIVAGDVFDKWNSPPELINFAIECFPEAYAIPGQHDLPNHRMEEITRSAYWTLVEAGNLIHLGAGATELDELIVYGYPWKAELEGPAKSRDDKVTLAAVHAYIWKSDRTSYPGAPIDSKVGAYDKFLNHFDAAVFGDNHIGFEASSTLGCSVINCGTFMRRHSNEYSYKPRVGLLYSDGSIQSHYLDTSKDVFYFQDDAAQKIVHSDDVQALLSTLKTLGDDSLDFRAVVSRQLDLTEANDEVRSLVLNSMEG